MVRILIVDDSPVDRKLAEGLLRNHTDWTIETAENGHAGLLAIRGNPPDAVLTDLQMPEMNGLELVTAAHREFPLVPVVLMTAKGSEEIAVQALHAGAASYVPKRRLATDLLDTVRRVLSGSTEQRSQSQLMNHFTRRDESFSLENDLAMLLSLAAYLQDTLCTLWTCDRSEIPQVGTALEEALLNALLHGNLELGPQLKQDDYQAYSELAAERARTPPYGHRLIHVTARFTPDAAEFAIRDEGAGFDPSKLPGPDDPVDFDNPTGRGIMLMRTFMDEVRFNDRGNEVTLVKRRSM